MLAHKILHVKTQRFRLTSERLSSSGENLCACILRRFPVAPALERDSSGTLVHTACKKYMNQTSPMVYYETLFAFLRSLILSLSDISIGHNS